MNWFKRNVDKSEFELINYGSLNLNKDRKGYTWVGMVQIPISINQIELTIEVEDKAEPSIEHIEILKDFENNWEILSDLLFTHLAESFQNSIWAKEKTELKKMYFLSGMELKRNKEELWIVFEPNFNIESIFNFLPRFTIKNNELIWSNIT